jgi:hypothetical protein
MNSGDSRRLVAEVKDKVEKARGGESVRLSSIVPPAFICHLTKNPMHDPVIGPDGHNYERSALRDKLMRENTQLVESKLVANLPLKQQIESYNELLEMAKGGDASIKEIVLRAALSAVSVAEQRVADLREIEKSLHAGEARLQLLEEHSAGFLRSIVIGDYESMLTEGRMIAGSSIIDSDGRTPSPTLQDLDMGQNDSDSVVIGDSKLGGSTAIASSFEPMHRVATAVEDIKLEDPAVAPDVRLHLTPVNIHFADDSAADSALAASLSANQANGRSSTPEPISVSRTGQGFFQSSARDIAADVPAPPRSCWTLWSCSGSR